MGASVDRFPSDGRSADGVGPSTNDTGRHHRPTSNGRRSLTARGRRGGPRGPWRSGGGTPRGGPGWCRRSTRLLVSSTLPIRPEISFRCRRARARASAGTDGLAAADEDHVDERVAGGGRRCCRGPCRSAGGDTRAGGCGGWSTGRALAALSSLRGRRGDRGPTRRRRSATGRPPPCGAGRRRGPPGAAGSGAGPGSGRAEAVAQDDLLDAEDPLEHRDVDARPAVSRRSPSASTARCPAGGARPARTGTTCR